MKSIEELKALRDMAKKELDMRTSDKDYKIVVGMATCGIAAGAREVMDRLLKQQAKYNYSVAITQTGCIGMCTLEPIVEVYDKFNNKTTYVLVNDARAKDIMKIHIGGGVIVEKYTVGAVNENK